MSAPTLAISTTTGDKLTGIVIENEIFSPSSSMRPFTPISQSAYSSDDEEEDTSSSGSTSPNLRFSFEDWDTPFNKTTPCEVEVDGSDGSQVLSIPSTSPFFRAPATPVFKHSFASTADCSLPSICPTLSSRFDLLLSSSVGGSAEVVVVDSESVLDDVFPRSIHVVKEMVEKDIPDFPEMVV